MFQCSKCPRRPKFAQLELLEEHVATQHFKSRPFQCQECSEYFGTEAAVISHSKQSHGLDSFAYSFHYKPGVLEMRDRIRKEAQLYQMEEQIKREVVEEDDRGGRGLKIEEGELEEEEEEMVDAAAATTSWTLPPQETARIGNINLAEFGADSILRDESILAELIKRNQDMTRQEDDRKKVECQKCGLMVSDQRSSRFYHANTRHIKLPLYECIACGKKWCTISRSDVVKHVQASHGGDERLILDHKARVRQQLRVLVELCFPRNKRESGTVLPDESDDCEEDEVRAAASPVGRKVKKEKLKEDGELVQETPSPATKKARKTGPAKSIFDSC